MINCVYIHIPFCEKKCKYCSFCSFNLLKEKNKYLEALKKEINFYYKKEPLKTLYFGGGTPSLLDEKDIDEILRIFNINSETEITLELNPHNISKTKIKEFKKIGINRLSIGVQSFDDEILEIIGRSHTKKEIFQTIEFIKDSEFKNFSIDLIYGLPEQDLKKWIETLDCALKINPNHISLYGLKIEKGTYFYKFPPKNLPDDDMQAIMYETASDKLDSFKHYEFSNFAKNDSYKSVHNLAYWKREPYWGFGLSASGFIHNKRYENTSNFREYIKNPLQKKFNPLSEIQSLEEEIFLGLRLQEGINFDKINRRYNLDIYKKYEKQFIKFLNLNLMEKTSDGIKLTLRGILLSNEILCEFIC